MTPAEITALLEVWRSRREALDAQLDALRAVINPTPENPLADAIEEIWNGYTVTIGRLIGDKADWLEWYWIDRQMGNHPGDVTLATETDAVRVDRDLRTLARVITWSPQA